MIQIPSTWRMKFAGCYVDENGDGHLFPTEAIRGLQIAFPKAGFVFTRADYELLVQAFEEMLDREKPRGRLYSKLTIHRSEEDEIGKV